MTSTTLGHKKCLDKWGAVQISGFLRLSNGLYKRFDETAFNTVFEMKKMKEALLDVGWKNVYFARVQDLKAPLDDS